MKKAFVPFLFLSLAACSVHEEFSHPFLNPPESVLEERDTVPEDVATDEGSEESEFGQVGIAEGDAGESTPHDVVADADVPKTPSRGVEAGNPVRPQRGSDPDGGSMLSPEETPDEDLEHEEKSEIDD